jgi:hypothetical protein
LLTERPRRVAQPVPVGGDDAQLIPVQHQQQSVEVITDILLRHRILDEKQQIPERFLRQRDLAQNAARVSHGWKIRGRQRLQVEAALAATHLQAIVLKVERCIGRIRQRAQDVLELAS